MSAAAVGDASLWEGEGGHLARGTDRRQCRLLGELGPAARLQLREHGQGGKSRPGTTAAQLPCGQWRDYAKQASRVSGLPPRMRCAVRLQLTRSGLLDAGWGTTCASQTLT